MAFGTFQSRGSGGMLSGENLNFRSLRNVILGILAGSPFEANIFWMAPLKSHQPPLPIKNEPSLKSEQKLLNLLEYLVKNSLFCCEGSNNRNEDKEFSSRKWTSLAPVTEILDRCVASKQSR